MFRILRIAKWLVLLGVPAFAGGWVVRQYDAFAFVFAQANECLAQVTSVEGNVLDDTGQKYIISVVLNRAASKGEEWWLSDMCAAVYQTHVVSVKQGDKKVKTRLMDFSGLQTHTYFEDFSRRFGWNDSTNYAFWMIVKEFLPFRDPDRLPWGYRYYLSDGPVTVDEFQRQNDVVCDLPVSYYASAKAERLNVMSVMYFCRLKDSPAWDS